MSLLSALLACAMRATRPCGVAVTWGVSSRWRWVSVPLPAAATTRIVMVMSLMVRQHKSTSYGSLQQHDAAAVATPPRRGQGCLAHMFAHAARTKQHRGSQFEYASSLAPAELVLDRHHHEVALRQVSAVAAWRSAMAAGRLLRDERA